MVCYSDGTPATVGDRARGVGYSPADRDYDPVLGIEGVVTEVRPWLDRDGGTLAVACLVARELVAGQFRYLVSPTLALHVETEYGDAAKFLKVG